MDPTIITFLEIVGLLILGIILIIALYLILQHYRTRGSQGIPQNKTGILLLAGLAMLAFIMMNLIGADILDSNRTFGLNVLGIVLAINLPFVGLTIWQWVVLSRKA